MFFCIDFFNDMGNYSLLIFSTFLLAQQPKGYSEKYCRQIYEIFD